MPAQMLGRPGDHCLYTHGSCDLPVHCTVLYKQTNYGFYRPGAISISNMLADLPFAAVRVLIFDIIVYFMTHLARSAGGFFTFHLFQFMAFLTMQVRGLRRQLAIGTLTCVSELLPSVRHTLLEFRHGFQVFLPHKLYHGVEI